MPAFLFCMEIYKTNVKNKVNYVSLCDSTNSNLFAFIIKLYHQVGHKKIFTIIHSKFVCIENRSISGVLLQQFALFSKYLCILIVTKRNAVVHNSFV